MELDSEGKNPAGEDEATNPSQPSQEQPERRVGGLDEQHDTNPRTSLKEPPVETSVLIAPRTSNTGHQRLEGIYTLTSTAAAMLQAQSPDDPRRRPKLNSITHVLASAAAQWDTEEYKHEPEAVPLLLSDKVSTTQKGPQSTHEANVQVRMSAQSDLLPLLVHIDERYSSLPPWERAKIPPQPQVDVFEASVSPTSSKSDGVRYALSLMFMGPEVGRVVQASIESDKPQAAVTRSPKDKKRKARDSSLSKGEDNSATDPQASKLDERKERKRKMDIVYAREKRKREKLDEEGLQQRCLELRKSKDMLLQEGKHLEGLLTEAIDLVARLEAAKNLLAAHAANAQARSSTQSDLLPVIAQLREQITAGSKAPVQPETPPRQPRPSPSALHKKQAPSVFSTVQHSISSSFKKPDATSLSPTYLGDQKQSQNVEPSPTSPLKTRAVTEGMSIDPTAVAAIFARLNQISLQAMPLADDTSVSNRDIHVDRQRVLNAVQQIPLAEKTAFCEAVKKSPELIKPESDPACFLRLSQGNDEVAARRIVGYWAKRRVFFGAKFLLPMHATGEGALNNDDVDLLKTGFLSFLPEDSKGHVVLFLNDTLAACSAKDEHSERLRRARCIFYMLSIAIQANKPITFIRLSDPAMSVPCEVNDVVSFDFDSVYHLYISRPFGTSGDSNDAAAMSLGQHSVTESGPAPIVYTGKAPYEFLEKLQKHGFSSESLPRSLGGQWGYCHFVAWIDQRRAAEACGAVEALSRAREEALSVAPKVPFSTQNAQSTLPSAILDSETTALYAAGMPLMRQLLPRSETGPTSQNLPTSDALLCQLIQGQDISARQSEAATALYSILQQNETQSQDPPLREVLSLLFQRQQEQHISTRLAAALSQKRTQQRRPHLEAFLPWLSQKSQEYGATDHAPSNLLDRLRHPTDHATLAGQNVQESEEISRNNLSAPSESSQTTIQDLLKSLLQR